MSIISSGGYYTTYTGPEVDQAVSVALSLSNYQTLQTVSASTSDVMIGGLTLTTPGAVSAIVNAQGYTTSANVSAYTSGAISSALIPYPTSSAVSTMISSAVISGVIDSAAVSAIVDSAILTSQLTSSAGVASQITNTLTAGGYITSLGAATVAADQIAMSNLIDSASVSAMIVSASGTTPEMVSSMISSSLVDYPTSSGASAIADNTMQAALVNYPDSSTVSTIADSIAHTVVQASGGALVRVLDELSTSVTIPILSGGTSFIYTQPLTVLSITSVLSVPCADFIRFTAASGGVVDIPGSVAVINNSTAFTGGATYLLGFQDGVMTWGKVVS